MDSELRNMTSIWIIRALALALLVSMVLGAAAMRHIARRPDRRANGTELVRMQQDRAVRNGRGPT